MFIKSLLQDLQCCTELEKNLKLFCVFSLKVKGLNHGIMCDISRAS